MKRLIAGFILIIMLGVGCDRNSGLDALYELNGSVDENPDSVLHLLLEMNTVMRDKEVSEESRALYGLVLTKAADKAHKLRELLGKDIMKQDEGTKDSLAERIHCYGEDTLKNGEGNKESLADSSEDLEERSDIFGGDSLINWAVEYYEKHVERGLLAEAYYYAGRTNAELLNGEKALLYYQKALMKDSEHISNHLRSRIYAQMGVMYLRNGLIGDARQMGELALFYCQQDSDTLGIRICEETIESISSMDAKGDSTVSDEKKMYVTMKVLRMNERLKSDLLNNRNEELSRENEKRKVLIWLIIGCVVAVVLGAVWMVRRQMKERRKLYEEMGTLNAKKRQMYDAETDEMIRRNVRSERPLKEKEWQEIEAKVTAEMPGFRERLYESHQFSELEYRICMLIKMGVSPSDMSTLLATSKSNVSQTRQRMQKKVFNGRGTAKDWDSYILSL